MWCECASDILDRCFSSRVVGCDGWALKVLAKDLRPHADTLGVECGREDLALRLRGERSVQAIQTSHSNGAVSSATYLHQVDDPCSWDTHVDMADGGWKLGESSWLASVVLLFEVRDLSRSLIG